MESAANVERADEAESAASGERAVLKESAGVGERARTAESAKSDERAVSTESAKREERAGLGESAAPAERAVKCEGADNAERAVPGESAVSTEQPIFRLGYPRIAAASHHLWEAQQTGWRDYLPHEAWRDLVRVHNAEKPQQASSADHPGFQLDYAPNYDATPETPEPDPAPLPGDKARR